MSGIDLDEIRERSQWALSHVLEQNAHYASAQDVPPLLARVAELETDLVGAFNLGRQWAIDALRDGDRFLDWERGAFDDRHVYDYDRERAARYLEHLAAHPDHSGG